MTRPIALFPLLAALLNACASNPPAATAHYQGLYEGQPSAVFGTEIPAGSAEEAMQRGSSALQQGNLDLALYLYVMALEQDDTQPEAFYRIGRIHAYRGNVARAIEAYQQVLARAPDHARALEELGLLLLGERQYEQAEQLLLRALAADGRRSEVHNGLGVIADLRRDHAGAAEHFEAALLLAPDSVQILNNLGYSHYLAGNWAQAEQMYQHVLALDPEHVLATRNLGLLYARRERYEEALALLIRVMEPAEAYNDLGYVSMLEGRHEEARTFLNEATRLSPSYYQTAYENLARNEEFARQRGVTALRPADPAQLSHYDPTAPVPEEQSAEVAGPARGWVTARSLQVRAAALEQAELLDQIPRGKLVHVLSREADWLYVWYWDHSKLTARERRGWIRSGHLTENRRDLERFEAKVPAADISVGALAPDSPASRPAM